MPGVRAVNGEDEDRSLNAFREALSGRRTRKNRSAQVIGVASVFAVIAAVAVGAMFFTGGDRTSKADPTGYRDPFICEKALRDKFEAEADAAEAGKPPSRKAGDPEQLFFCATDATRIAKLRGGKAEGQKIMANAIYALEIDGQTRVKGLDVQGMRFGWAGKVCAALKAPAGEVLLKGIPVDPVSC
jgi:hypothetical protein